MEHFLEEAIDSYNCCFVWYEGRMGEPCKLCSQGYTLDCMMLDSIQISGCYIEEIMRGAEEFVNKEEAICWNYVKKEDAYFFYPLVDYEKLAGHGRDLEKLMLEEGIEACRFPKKKNTYLEAADAFMIFQTCQKNRRSGFVFSPALIVDLWFYMNSSCRSLEQLQDISKIFCAGSLAVTHRFLENMLEHIKADADREERKRLYEAASAFVDAVERMAQALSIVLQDGDDRGCLREADFLRELGRTGVRFSNAYRKRHQSLSGGRENALDFSSKAAWYLKPARMWSREKKVKGRTIEGYLAKMRKAAGICP